MGAEGGICPVVVAVSIMMSSGIFNTSVMFQAAVITFIDARLTHHLPLGVGESF